jgi:hypothetical protein
MRKRHHGCSTGMQPRVRLKQPLLHSHWLIVLLLAGAQPQAPTMPPHVASNADAEAQHRPLVTRPPVVVHNVASDWVPPSMLASLPPEPPVPLEPPLPLPPLPAALVPAAELPAVLPAMPVLMPLVLAAPALPVSALWLAQPSAPTSPTHSDRNCSLRIMNRLRLASLAERLRASSLFAFRTLPLSTRRPSTSP